MALEAQRRAVAELNDDNFEAVLGTVRDAVTIAPYSARLHYNAAILEQRRRPEKLTALLRTLAIDPLHTPARNALSQHAMLLGEHRPSIAHARLSVLTEPAQSRIWQRIATLLTGQGAVGPSERAALRAVALAPSDPTAAAGLTLAVHLDIRARDRLVRAAEHAYSAALGGQTDLLAHALFLKGIAAQETGREADARRNYVRSLSLAPRNRNAFSNLAAAAVEAGDLDSGRRYAEEVLRRAPDNAEALWIRSWAQLLDGDLENGFVHYDIRYQKPARNMRQNQFPLPLWDGKPLASPGRVLIWAESGVGDEVLAAGMLGDAARVGPKIVFECDRRFQPLFQRSFPEIEVVARDISPADAVKAPDLKAQCSGLRLPYLFRRTWESFPPGDAYLTADPEKVARYRTVFSELGPGPTIGIGWSSGNPRTGGRKSTRLAEWEPLLRQDDITLVSLQYGEAADEVDEVRAAGFRSIHANPLGDVRKPLDDVAAQIAAMDCVISIAGINGHLTGALGRPGLIMVQSTPLWFWFRRGETCPWYRSLRLIRQRQGEGWKRLIETIADCVARRAWPPPAP